MITKESLTPPEPAQPERSQRTRRPPPRYLADYAVGHLELPLCDGSPSSADDYPILVGNSLQYSGEFHQEEESPNRISEGTQLLELSLQSSLEIPTDHVPSAAAGKISEP